MMWKYFTRSFFSMSRFKVTISNSRVLEVSQGSSKFFKVLQGSSRFFKVLQGPVETLYSGRLSKWATFKVAIRVKTLIKEIS